MSARSLVPTVVVAGLALFGLVTLVGWIIGAVFTLARVAILVLVVLALMAAVTSAQRR